MGIRTSDDLSLEKFRLGVVTDLTGASIGDPPQTEPPSQAQIEVSNDELVERQQRVKLIDKKIELFARVVWWALFAFALLVILLVVVICVYLYLLWKNINIPSNFWHIPLLLAVMASTILSITLTLSSRFGSNQTKYANSASESSILANTPPAWQEIVSTVKESIKEIRR